MLRMEVVPPVGGDTLFMDMRQVFSNLSSKMQDLLKQLSARHDPVGHYLYLSGQKALHELPSGHHPIVRQIPETGDVALYVNEGFTRGIDGLAESESKFLLRFLFDTIRASVPAQIRVKWRPIPSSSGTTGWFSTMRSLTTSHTGVSDIGQPSAGKRRSRPDHLPCSAFDGASMGGENQKVGLRAYLQR